MKNRNIFIGTSGWHYRHWMGTFYPEDVKGYEELRYHSKTFNSVENNSSFYRISRESTYKTWDRMTDDTYSFSMKLNKAITHIARLELTDEVKEKVTTILDSTEILGDKLGALVIQLPPSFKDEHVTLKKFLTFFMKRVSKRKHPLDISIEFRNRWWDSKETYDLLKEFNVALVAADSSRYPQFLKTTADHVYIRLHGPEKLFASSYSKEQLTEWRDYITNLPKRIKTVRVYFNNDFHGYALSNGLDLMELLNQPVHNDPRPLPVIK